MESLNLSTRLWGEEESIQKRGRVRPLAQWG